MTGILIDFEGIDGAGKKTQTTLLANKLRERQLQVRAYSYPDYESKYGELIREFLDSRFSLSAEEQLLLYLLDMVKDKQEVQRMLSERFVVIADRYFPSTIAYQCAAGFPYEKAKRISELLALPVPSVIFYLQMPVDVTRRRKIQNQHTLDRFEGDAELLVKVQAMYERMIAESFPSSLWTKLDGTKRPEALHRQILLSVEQLLTRGSTFA